MHEWGMFLSAMVKATEGASIGQRQKIWQSMKRWKMAKDRVGWETWQNEGQDGVKAGGSPPQGGLAQTDGKAGTGWGQRAE